MLKLIVATYGTIYSDGAVQEGEFQSEQLFHQNLLLQITMDLYDVNMNEVENWKNKVNDDFVLSFRFIQSRPCYSFVFSVKTTKLLPF